MRKLLLVVAVAVTFHYASPVTAQEGCVENPGVGFSETISGVVDGDTLSITVSDRFGGAVESLRWRDMEFINTWDHGRQISYAWSLDGYGECLNPTEPGSARDFQAATSTSELLSVCKPEENVVTTLVRPAYWLAPGESGFCDGGAATAVNEDLVSDQLLRKSIQIGYEGIENVIVFEVEITNPEDRTFMQAEIPTAYLTKEFSRFYWYNPQSDELTSPESEPLVAPWEYQAHGTIPPIIATEDGEFALGAYYAGPKLVYYGMYLSESTIAEDETTKWNMVTHEEPFPEGTYSYRSFAIAGTLADVQAAMQALYALHPVDATPPMGYVDLVSCERLAGWAWDPGFRDQPVEVAIYDVVDDEEQLLLTVEAAIFRTDLVEALGDNGRHGFNVPTPLELRDGEPHTIRMEAVNPEPGVAGATLMPALHELTCAAVEEPTATPRPTATAEAPTPLPTPQATAEPAETAEPTPTPAADESAAGPCGLPLLALGFVVAGGRMRRRREGRR